jgi:ribosomal protein L11 methyltransferase
MSVSGRRWLELRARCRSAGERAALLTDGLLAIGGRAVEERGGWFVTHLEEPEDLDDCLSVVSSALTAITGLDAIEVVCEWQAHEDWAEVWRTGIRARRVGQRIVVRPSWIEHTAAGDDDIVIVLDPGMAFGTAEHGSTRGCLRLLERAVRRGDRVLDVGAGSGILSIAAAALGAGSVVAFEGDRLACEALIDNVTRNGVEDRVRVVEEWVDEGGPRAHRPASGIVANLERGILLPLLPGLVTALESDGWMIVAGILEAEWPDVERALEEQGLDTLYTDTDEGWRSGLLTRRA